MKHRSPDHDELVALARRFSQAALLPALARISNAQVSGRNHPAWPHPWTIALVARECIAYSNEYRRSGPVTDRYLARLRDVGINQLDPYANEAGQRDAMESVVVRYVYQQIPFTSYDPLGELARLAEVCRGDDAYYGSLGLEVITTRTWTELLGMPLEVFIRAGFAVLSQARLHDGWFDPASLADSELERCGVTPDQALHVFHHFMATELADLKERAAADRNPDPPLRRLDFNPLVKSPFVGLGSGRYVAPSMHLAEQRLSLSALYYLGQEWFGADKVGKGKFTSDIGKLIEAYVGRQLDQLAHDALVPEQTYGTKKNRRETCDWVLAINGISTIFEVKSARIAVPGRLSYPAYLDDMQNDVGKALAKQIPNTAELIRTGDQVYAEHNLPTDVYGVVVTAEPHLMINSENYRNVMPDPGCPYVVLSLRELEWFVATVLAGVDADDLVRTLTSSHQQPDSVMTAAARAVGVENVPPSALLSDAIDRSVGLPPESDGP